MDRIRRTVLTIILLALPWSMAAAPALAEPAAPANDDFAAAEVVTTLPFEGFVDTTAATIEDDEPHGSCVTSASHTVWYRYEPSERLVIGSSASAMGPAYWAMWRGSSLESLEEIGCRTGNVLISALVEPGETYYFQVGLGWPGLHEVTFRIRERPLVADFHFDQFMVFPGMAIRFESLAVDPAELGIASWEWDFGDGATADGPVVWHSFGETGTYAVTSTVSTVDGRTAAQTRHVTVTEDGRAPDTAPPHIFVPWSVFAYIESEAGAAVTYWAHAWDDRDGPVPVDCDPPSGSLFPIGVTVVNCTAVDGAGNAAAASFEVTVGHDTTPPFISVPWSVFAYAESDDGAVVEYWVFGWDERDGHVEVTCDPPSGPSSRSGQRR